MNHRAPQPNPSAVRTSKRPKTGSTAPNFSAATSDSQLGTLLWIGNRSDAEFHEAYQFCEAQAAQLAVRQDLAEAVRRPASEVKCILVSTATRQPLNRNMLQTLAQTYPSAARMQLMGSLCEGMCRTADPFFEANRQYWHRWNQWLPGWLQRCGAMPTSNQSRCKSVLVLAANYVKAEPLLELAQSSGATAIVAHQIDVLRVRNVDAVWWDDSLARPTTSEQWQQRLAPLHHQTHPPRHAWLVTAPRIDQSQAAARGGVDLVLSKPHRIEPLLNMLADERCENPTTATQQISPAAKAA